MQSWFSHEITATAITPIGDTENKTGKMNLLFRAIHKLHDIPQKVPRKLIQKIQNVAFY